MDIKLILTQIRDFDPIFYFPDGSLLIVSMILAVLCLPLGFIIQHYTQRKASASAHVFNKAGGVLRAIGIIAIIPTIIVLQQFLAFILIGVVVVGVLVWLIASLIQRTK